MFDKIKKWIENKLGLGTKTFTEQMRKGDKYRLVFKYYGELTEARIKKATDGIIDKLKGDLEVTKIVFNEPKVGKVTVEGIALHDPIPFLLIGGLIGGIALLFGLRLALESVYKIMNLFTPNKILLLCVLLGVPYLVFTGKIKLKGLKLK